MPVYKSHNDTPLLLRLVKGDEAAFRTVFDAYYVPLCGFAGTILNNATQSEDTVQEVFCRLWDKRATLSGIRNLRAFLYTMVRNACFDHLRREDRKNGWLNDFFSANENENDINAYLNAAAIREEVLQIIMNEIKTLPGHYSTILKLLFIEGLDYQEISERLQVPVATLRKQKERALQQLRENIQPRQVFNTTLLAPQIIFLLDLVTKP